MIKSIMETRYEEYLLEDDTVIEIDGKTFYKAVCVEKLSEIKMMFITLPFAMFNGKYGNIEGQLLIDEFGNVFKIRGLEQIRFIGNTPSWYFECGKIFIDAPENIDMSIGEYFALESGDHK